MVGVLAVGFVANLMIRPVDRRFHEPERERAAAGPSGAGATAAEAKENHVPSFLLPVAWLVVGVPLAYGVYETVVKAIDLFG